MTRWIALCCLLIAATAACGKYVRHTDAVITPVPPRTVGGGVHLPTTAPTTGPTPTPTKTAPPPSFSLLLEDDNHLHPAQIAVEAAGSIKRTFVSGADGRVTGNLPAGFYSFKVIEGCQDEAFVQDGGSAKVGIVEGQTVRGTLLLIWEHRYGPGSPVRSSETSDWNVGKPVQMSFAIVDHCNALTPASNRTFETYRYKTSPAVRVSGAPTLRSGADGRASVSVVCTKPGDVALDVYDGADPDDKLDLIQASIGYNGVPRCVAK